MLLPPQRSPLKRPEAGCWRVGAVSCGGSAREAHLSRAHPKGPSAERDNEKPDTVALAENSSDETGKGGNPGLPYTWSRLEGGRARCWQLKLQGAFERSRTHVAVRAFLPVPPPALNAHMHAYACILMRAHACTQVHATHIRKHAHVCTCTRMHTLLGHPLVTPALALPRPEKLRRTGSVRQPQAARRAQARPPPAHRRRTRK